MKQQHYDQGSDFESEDLPPTLTSRIEQLTRKWAEEEQHRNPRHPQRTLARRRIEDWRDDRVLRRQLDDDLGDI